MLPRCYCRPSDARAHCPSKPISTSACRGQRLTAGGSKNNRRASPWTHNFFVEAPQQPPAPSKKEKYGPLLRCGLIKKDPLPLWGICCLREAYSITHILSGLQHCAFYVEARDRWGAPTKKVACPGACTGPVNAWAGRRTGMPKARERSVARSWRVNSSQKHQKKWLTATLD